MNKKRLKYTGCISLDLPDEIHLNVKILKKGDLHPKIDGQQYNDQANTLRKMKTITTYLTLFALLITLPILAQVGIGTTTPDPSAIMDITATDKGLLIPRVLLDDVNNA